jgi:transcriptional regulator GlxA family with amidase domain
LTANALSLVAHRHCQELVGTPDSLVLICGQAARHTRDHTLFTWLRCKARRVRRLGAVCVARFVLGEAGLLDGKRATAHWKYAQEMAARYPRVTVDPRAIWVQAGKISTSAGQFDHVSTES